MEHNWVQTIPGKGWFMILRLYGPLEPWFDETWRPGEIEMASSETEIQKLKECREQAAGQILEVAERIQFIAKCIR